MLKMVVCTQKSVLLLLLCIGYGLTVDVVVCCDEMSRQWTRIPITSNINGYRFIGILQLHLSLSLTLSAVKQW